MHPRPENWVSTGRVVVYFVRDAPAFGAGIKCLYCRYYAILFRLFKPCEPGMRSCILSGVPLHLVQELNVCTVGIMSSYSDCSGPVNRACGRELYPGCPCI